jgi:hypothetical protein
MDISHLYKLPILAFASLIVLNPSFVGSTQLEASDLKQMKTSVSEVSHTSNSVESNGLRFETLQPKLEPIYLSPSKGIVYRISLQIRITNTTQTVLRFGELADLVEIVGEDSKPLIVHRGRPSLAAPLYSVPQLQPGQSFIRTMPVEIEWKSNTIAVSVWDFIDVWEYQISQPGKYRIRFRYANNQKSRGIRADIDSIQNGGVMDVNKPLSQEKFWVGDVITPFTEFILIDP